MVGGQLAIENLCRRKSRTGNSLSSVSSGVFLVRTTEGTEDTERQFCLRRFQKMEVSAGFVHIARYLFAQRIDRGKFNLVAQAL